VFAYHHVIIERLMETLADQGVSGFIGSSSLRDRDRAAEKFQHDPNCQFFIGNIEAAGQERSVLKNANLFHGALTLVRLYIFHGVKK